MDKSKVAVAMFNKMAKLYEDTYMNVDSYSESLNLFCQALNCEDAIVLELGCGPGNLTKFILDRLPKCKILATDLAPNMIEIAKSNCPGATFKIMDFRETKTLKSHFDAVVAGFCIPYLSMEEVVELIQSVSTLLKSEGLLYLSTMEGKYTDSRLQNSSSVDEVFVHFYERNFLIDTLHKNGFKIVKVWDQPDLSQKRPTTDLIIIAKK